MRRMIIRLLSAFLLLAPLLARGQEPTDPRMMVHALGDPKAPIRIDEYYSLDCPHCAAFVIETLPALKADYIDKGKVYLVLNDFPLHELSLRATELARCAPPERFFPMVDTLFRVQRGWLLQSEVDSLEALKQQAKFAGMTNTQIDDCLNDRSLEDAVLNERLAAEKDWKVNATPTFVFNKKSDDRIVAAEPYSLFKDKIEALLKK